MVGIDCAEVGTRCLSTWETENQKQQLSICRSSTTGKRYGAGLTVKRPETDCEFQHCHIHCGGFDLGRYARQPGWCSLPSLIRPCGLPSARIPPDRDLAGGTSCTISLRFSSLKIAPGGIPSSADKWVVDTTRAVERMASHQNAYTVTGIHTLGRDRIRCVIKCRALRNQLSPVQKDVVCN